MVADSNDVVLECRGLGHSFGKKKVLNDINLSIGRGQIVALVGPSGSGKSTLLRAILGTHPAKQGETLMDGKPYREPSRDRGIVYQKYSLFSFLTCEQNVAFGLKLDATSAHYRFFQFWKWRELRKQHLAAARELLEDVGLGEVENQYPEELSGGMRQRVAIAQALIMRPKLLLLDEPFGALDEATREELQLMLLNLYAENQAARRAGQTPPYTILIVTHELNEAIYVSDRVLGLSQYHQDGKEGATIVYDKAAPVYEPHSPKDVNAFVSQREELLRAVFSNQYIQHHSEYVTFWRDHGLKPAALN
ncbi:MAG: ABC transporter ATP-binding protein [Pirellulaceae bacterium]